MPVVSTLIVNAAPVAFMIALIPAIKNDYFLAGIYLAIAAMSFVLYREKNDLYAYVFGLLIITLAETYFIMTGVEVFQRTSFLGIMPIWLPLLWAYAFVAIKRSVRMLDISR
jgi:hypothetical protein